MRDNNIQEAFFDVLRDAKPAQGCYVSLYVRTPYYGGPEEGGWWGEDRHLVAYQWFPTEESAADAKEQVQKRADELNAQERAEFGEHCLRQLEWLEARGLDSDFLPEPDGELVYYVTCEDIAGSGASQGCRHYE